MAIHDPLQRLQNFNERVAQEAATHAQAFSIVMMYGNGAFHILPAKSMKKASTIYQAAVSASREHGVYIHISLIRYGQVLDTWHSSTEQSRIDQAILDSATRAFSLWFQTARKVGVVHPDAMDALEIFTTAKEAAQQVIEKRAAVMRQAAGAGGYIPNLRPVWEDTRLFKL